MRTFDGLEEFEKFKTEVLKHVTGKANKKLAKAFRPSSNMDEKWKRSVEGKLSDPLIFAFIIKIWQEPRR